jgi:E3 ubiquitin-protein ligase mind-bomb
MRHFTDAAVLLVKLSNIVIQNVEDLEDQFLCGICMERKRNVAFLCGHGACTQCTLGLSTCHMCRTAIERKIPLY